MGMKTIYIFSARKQHGQKQNSIDITLVFTHFILNSYKAMWGYKHT